ncbi:MAG: hypothetical protein DSZ02_02425 [Gammaproteobacteria bacterium]|nr:MAG: hypothetical protein DSZ02_02425 [Gammaproteobacteria bacterium]
MPISSEASRSFHRFLGLHAFLTGLFPFFIPVYLWRQGHDAGQISLFIAITGTGFVLSLVLWDRIRTRLPFHQLIALTFLVEILLLSAVFLEGENGFLLLFGLLNGAYNCFFWITQRALFLETLALGDTGRKVGNFQIFVMVMLKLGIFSGGLLLDVGGYPWLFLFSVLIAGSGLLSFQLRQVPQPAALQQMPPLSPRTVFGFRDSHGSRTVFLLDGPFLFLESYFWAITLFLLAHQSFWRLGLLVIVLGLIFSLLFWLIKNRIDHLPVQRVYRIAVGGYALSWLLRLLVDRPLATGWLFLLLVLITFATSFFRLAFNKRFFDIARQSGRHRYLLLKSYWSQAAIAVAFPGMALVSTGLAEGTRMLELGYLLAALAAPFYLLYRPPR